MSEDRKRIFISYAREDKEFARELAESMKRSGVSVFSDIDVMPGALWSDVLRREIEQASALVLIIPSYRVANRNNIWFEAGAAKALGKPVLAVLPPQREPKSIELPTDLAGLIVLDADRRSVQSVAETLLQAIPAQSAEAATAE
jgi:predicted nucleotide-binding protein